MKYLIYLIFSMFIAIVLLSKAFAAPYVSMDEDGGLGFALGGGSEAVDLSICPEGARVVRSFFTAWRSGNYEGMYQLLDEESKKDYSFDQAKFDFQFMEFKTYKISSVRKAGDVFEFILSSGDWKDGDKETKKMVISGQSFRIIMPSRGNVFKESLDNYF